MRIAIRAVIVASFLLISFVSYGASQGQRTVAVLEGDIGVAPPEGSLLSLPAGLFVQETSVVEALTLLSTKTNLSVALSPNSLPTDHKARCDCETASIAEALDQILSGTGYGYIELDEQIIIVKIPPRGTLESLKPALNRVAQNGMSGPLSGGRSYTQAQRLSTLSRPLPEIQQRGTIQGQVVNERTGQGVPSAQVFVVGTSQGSLTDDEGRYALLMVPSGEQTVEVRHLGYRTRTQAVRVTDGATIDLDFLLEETAIRLDALVVTGTPVATRRVEIGNALSQLDASEIRRLAPVTSLSQMLQGRTPGVRIQTRSGMVGSGSAISIRGGSSLSLSNRPMIYVDGIRVDNEEGSGPAFTGSGTPSRLDDISPEDIASIEIIRGPAAATLYGTEASNGVIQIITHRGTPGTAPVVTATIRGGATWLPHPEEVFEPKYYTQPDGTILVQNLVAEEAAAGRPIFRTGLLTNFAVNIRGGAQRVGYYVSAQLEKMDGYIPKNELTRTGGRANLNIAVRDNLDLQMSMGVSRNKIGLAPEGFSGNFGVIPMIEFGTPRVKDTSLRGFNRAPPEATRTIDLISDVDRATASFKVSYRPSSWLSSRLILGTDVVNENNLALFPRQPEGSDHFFGGRGLGEVTVDTRRSRMNTMDFSTTAQFDVSPSVRSTTSVGLQYFGRRTDWTGAFGKEFPAVGVSTVSAAAVTTASESWVENTTVGAFVQQRVGLNDRLFVTAALRGDDNSAFGEGYDAAIYPKLGMSWLVSDESFFRDRFAGIVDELRLRFSWGQSGMQPDAFAAATLYAPITGPGNVATLTPGALGNEDLGPEKGTEIESGFDASFLNHRLSAAFTFFTMRTKDAIFRRSIPPSSGFGGTQFVNIGELSRRGVELEISTVPIRGPQVTWRVGTAFSTLQNRIEDMGGLPSIVFSYRLTQAHVEGFPIGSFFFKKIIQAERDPATGDIVSFACDGGTGPVGDHMRPGGAPVDCAGAPSIFLGKPGPGLEGSLFSTLELPWGLDLHMNISFTNDYRMMDVTRSANSRYFKNNYEWTYRKEGDPLLQAYMDNNMGIIGLENADFIRLQDLSLSHRISPGLLERLGTGMSSASITLAARNLKTWTRFNGLDPEVRGSSTSFANNAQTLTPLPVQFIVTVRGSF